MLNAMYNSDKRFGENRRLFECCACKAMIYAKKQDALPCCLFCGNSDFQMLAKAGKTVAGRKAFDLLFQPDEADKASCKKGT
ncbi:hypothetical protein R6258_13350 [Halomonas sp. HP20-15]|uniref:hypothetical protein n=1 Tax=Halomonas sp. HP20-15 TaxID=3085901 RepID=UPI002981B24E|nr:hypothetical protein [Halomonas sp. HP20-15]MDW5377911.1 hypothetical protein [Halomonas sp. HP20-15]